MSRSARSAESRNDRPPYNVLPPGPPVMKRTGSGRGDALRLLMMTNGRRMVRPFDSGNRRSGTTRYPVFNSGLGGTTAGRAAHSIRGTAGGTADWARTRHQENRSADGGMDSHQRHLFGKKTSIHLYGPSREMVTHRNGTRAL